MCLAIPGKVIEILPEDRIKVDFGGVIKTVITTLIGDVPLGKYVIVHAGHAIEIMNEDDALETKKLLTEMLEANDII